MYLNQFENSSDSKLQQILHTLKNIHGIELSFDVNTISGERALLECQNEYESKRLNIINESAFNSYQQNPEYIKTMLILEAVRTILKEIAPKRRRSKKIAESINEANQDLSDALTIAATAVKQIDTDNDIYGREQLRIALLKLKELAPSYVTPDSKVNNHIQQVLKLTSQKVYSPDEVLFYLEKAKAEYDKTHVGEAMSNWMQTIKNEFEKYWNATPDEEKTRTSRDAAYKKFLRDKEAEKAAKSYAKQHPRMEDNNTMQNKQTLLKLANAMINYSEKAAPKTEDELAMMNNFSRVGQKLTDLATSSEAGSLSKEDKDVAMYALRKLKADGLLEQDQDGDGDEDFADIMVSRMTASGMPKSAAIAKTTNKDYNKESIEIAEGIDISKVTQQAQHYEYQASMARSELYRNTKYAMSMMHQIDPQGEVTPWIAGALTKAANYLDKIYHYLDYYKNFEPEKLPENIDGDMELGETSGGVTRQNLMLISEYSIKLFNMIQPGDKLEGWVAMKLTTASECVSSCKHYMDYVQFEQHALDDHFDTGRRAVQKNMMEAKQDDSEIIGDISAIELAKAQLILNSKDMSSQIQGMAQDVAKLSVEDLMPLVNRMRSLFGPEVASGFNSVAKDIFDNLLSVTTDTKEKLDEAIDTVNRGGVPSEKTDIESAPEPEEAPEEPSPLGDLSTSDAGEEMPEPGEPLGRAKKDLAESRFQFDKKTGSMKLNNEDPDQRHGLYGADGKLMRATNTKDEAENLKTRDPKYKNANIKKIAESKKVDEKWGTEMHTAEKDKGKWDGYTVAELKDKKAKLMKKEKRSAADQKTVKQLTFAIRAKQKDKRGKVKESTQINEKSPPGKEAEKWIKSNKPRFIKQYGKKKGMSVLYAKAWDMFGSKTESYQQYANIIEESNKILDMLHTQLSIHQREFSKLLQEGKVSDPLNVGYGLHGELIKQKIAEVSNKIISAKTVMMQEMQNGINRLLSTMTKHRKADKLSETKAITPYGVIYTSVQGKKSKKMFESIDTRDYWIDLHSNEVSNVKLINPETFDKAINNTLKGE